MKACGNVPVISPWLYRQEIRRVARRAAAGDLPAVRNLAAVFCTSPDTGARARAAEGLRHLQNPDQAALLCREAIEWDNAGLHALVRGCRYLPASPGEKAIWFFCTSQPDELCAIDTAEHYPLLAAGYTAADAPLRLQARNAARRDNTCTILARALAGTSVTKNASCWSYDEWDVVITGLKTAGCHDDLWLLATLAPVPLAVDAVQALRTAGWSPRGDDRVVWEELARNLPDRRTFPPACQHRRPVGRPAGRVACLSFSPDGSLFATGTCDGVVTVRCTASSGSAAEFLAGPGAVVSLAIPPDNSVLVSAADDGTIRCCSLEDRALLWSRECRGAGRTLTLAPDGLTVLAGDEQGTLYVLNTRDAQVLYALRLHPSPITCIGVAAGSPAVACGHADGTVSIVRPWDGRRPLFLPGNGSPVAALTISPDGRECLVVWERGPPALHDIEGGTKRCTFTGHSGRAVCTALPPVAGWFAVGSDDHTLRCWDLHTGQCTIAIPFYSRHITSVSAAPDGSLLAAGLHDGSVRIWRMPGGEPVKEFRGHKKTITACTLAPGNSRLATVSWDGSTKIWRIPEGDPVRTFDSHAGGIAALAGPAGTLVAAVTEDGVARVIDASEGTVTGNIDLYTPAIRAAAISPDGAYLASTGTDSSLRVWDVRNGSLAAAADHHTTSWRCCTFLPGGAALVAGGWDGTCRLFRIPDAVPLRSLCGHTSIVTCCTVSRDGEILVTGSNDTTVRLWRFAEEEAYAVLRDSRSEVGAVALSPDGTLLAAGNREGILRIYRLPQGVPVRGLPAIPGAITSLAFSGDGCILAAGYDTGTCAFFSLPERVLVHTVPAHTGAVSGLGVLPDGITLVSSGADGLCCFHAMPCVRFPIHARLADITGSTPGSGKPSCPNGQEPSAFHRALLAARFREEIGICTPMDITGCYDIQIVG
jgi:WD40 repeat protein